MPEFPSPPTTSDPIAWIAVALVAAGIVGAGFWLPRLLAAVQEDRAAALKAFREECSAERAAHAAAIAGIREDHEVAHARLHDRLSAIDSKVTTLAAQNHRAA